MSFRFLILCSIFIIITTTHLHAQEVMKVNEVRMIQPEEIGSICTLDPTDFNAHFHHEHVEIRGKMSSELTGSTFDVTYLNNCGSEEWPAEAIAAFEYATDIWSQHISSDITIAIGATWRDLSGNTLGSAGPSLVFTITGDNVKENTYYPIAQASAILGTDLKQVYSVNYDINVNMNCSFQDWYYGTDANTPSGLIDMVTVVLHEIGHGLGFTGSLMGDNDSETAEWGLGPSTIPMIYDTFTKDGLFESVIDTDFYPNSSNFLYQASTGQRDGIFFDGSNAENAMDGLRVPLYTPTPFMSGSSYSHLDLNFFSTGGIYSENALMRPSIDRAFAIHSPGPVFCGMLKDMGWPLGASCELLLDDSPDIIVNHRADWNLIGVPVSTSGSGLNYLNLFQNSQIQQPPQKFNSTYEDASELIEAEGYWLHLTGTESVGYSGTLLENISLSLNEGWNLISGIGYELPEYTVSDPQGIISSAWYGFDGAYFTANTIEPGRGYWLKANSPGTITLERQVGKTPALIAEMPWHRFNPSDSFYSLMFISEQDTLQSLYFGGALPNDMPPSRFIMPPLPPQGAFDARISVTQSTLSQNNEVFISVQSTDKNMKIFVKPPSAPTDRLQSWSVVQLIDGISVHEQNVMVGDEITLYNEEVNGIQLSSLSKQNTLAENEPLSFFLDQNYPNPFNPTTLIRFVLPEQSRVTLNVYNIAGQRVATLLNQTMREGSHAVNFDASSLTSGVYIYELSAGQFRETRKMTVVR